MPAAAPVDVDAQIAMVLRCVERVANEGRRQEQFLHGGSVPHNQSIFIHDGNSTDRWRSLQ